MKQRETLQMFLRSPAAIVGSGLLCLIMLFTFVGPHLYRVDPLAMVGVPFTEPFTADNAWLGTDQLGRDVLAGLVNGGAMTLAVSCLFVTLDWHYPWGLSWVLWQVDRLAVDADDGIFSSPARALVRHGDCYPVCAEYDDDRDRDWYCQLDRRGTIDPRRVLAAENAGVHFGRTCGWGQNLSTDLASDLA